MLVEEALGHRRLQTILTVPNLVPHDLGNEDLGRLAGDVALGEFFHIFIIHQKASLGKERESKWA